MLRAAMESAKWASRAPVARKEKDTVELRRRASDLDAEDAAQSPAPLGFSGLGVSDLGLASAVLSHCAADLDRGAHATLLELNIASAAAWFGLILCFRRV